MQEYLNFNNVWKQKKEYEAHKKRLINIKSTQYQNSKDKQMIDSIVNHQIQCNRKNYSFRMKNIYYQNQHIVKRLISIAQSKPKKNEYKIQLPSKSARHADIQQQNFKLRQRLQTIQPYVKTRNQINDFRRHLYYRDRMEKFSIEDNKVILKASSHIKNYELKLKNKQHNKSYTHLLPLSQKKCRTEFNQSFNNERSNNQYMTYRNKVFLSNPFVNNAFLTNEDHSF